MKTLSQSQSASPHGSTQQIAVIGLGALGSELCRRLAQGQNAPAAVMLIDPDVLEPENTATSRLYAACAAVDPSCFGRSKVAVLAEQLKVSGDTRWEAIPCEIADVGWQRFATADLLITCADNALARLEAAQIARSLGKPVLDLGLFGAEHEGGRVTWFSPGCDAACYSCGLTDDFRAQLLAYANAPTLGCRLPPGMSAMSDHPDIFHSLDRVCAAAMEVVQQGRDCGHSYALRFSGPGSAAERIHLSRSASCPFHQPLGGRLVKTSEQTPLSGLFDRTTNASRLRESERLQLPWPLCVQSHCTRCGTLERAPQRLARLRRHGVCGACGVRGVLEPVRTISVLRKSSPHSSCTPRQLGLPSEHLLLLRPAFQPEYAVPEQTSEELHEGRIGT